MSILNFLRVKSPAASAEQAKERLKIVLAHERSYASAPDYLPRLQNEILQVIARYVELEQDKLTVKLENFGSVSRLEVNIDLPKSSERAAAPTELGGEDGDGGGPKRLDGDSGEEARAAS